MMEKLSVNDKNFKFVDLLGMLPWCVQFMKHFFGKYENPKEVLQELLTEDASKNEDRAPKKAI